MSTNSLVTLFHLDALAGIMMTLVCFIGLIVGLFAVRYMQGDSKYNKFFGSLGLLVLSVMVMVASDHLLVLLIAWGFSNFFLVRIMIHKSTWKAATNSGCLAGKAFIIGFICLASAFALLYYCTGQTSIKNILHSLDETNPLNIIAMALLVVAAISQSAIWPFHRWLISSLNSPTPVSAIMHAGLVNGGGFLLVRFAPLYFSQPKILTVIFILGLVTALVGTLWKLMQNDIKRMLACSTLGQMGFMFVQCGLGLFPAAVAHLCWHGLFKANLFLSSSSASQEKRLSIESMPTMEAFFLAFLCGIFGSYMFALVSHKPWFAADTTLILLSVVLIAAAQFAVKLLQSSPWKQLPMTILLTGLMGTLYGCSVYVVELILSPLDLMHPQELNIFHYLGLILMVVLWLMMMFKNRLTRHHNLSRLLPMLYVRALNASQPHPSTITSHRNQYRYE